MITETDAGGFRVSCEVLECPRPLMRVVGSKPHARNLARKHRRDYHDGEVEFSQADVDALVEVMQAHIYQTYENDPGHLEECARVVLAAGYVAPPF